MIWVGMDGFASPKCVRKIVKPAESVNPIGGITMSAYKRVLSVLVLTVLLLGLISGSAPAEENQLKDGLKAIHVVNVEGFRAPVAGSTPMDSYYLSVDKGQNYYIVYQYWYDNTLDEDMNTEDIPFDKAHLYSAGCLICPNDGYYIAEDCVFKMNGSTKLTDSAQCYPHAYLEGTWFVRSVAVQCAEKEVTPVISLSPSSFVYDGAKKKPKVTVKVGKTVLKQGTDYTVAYINNVNAGTAKAIVTLKGKRSGTGTKTFKISKAPQQLKVGKKNQTVRYTEIREKSKIISGAITVEGAEGQVVYKKESGSDYLTIGKKTGKITVRKGTPKGTYTITVTVTAKATANYKKTTQKITVKIKVK